MDIDFLQVQKLQRVPLVERSPISILPTPRALGTKIGATGPARAFMPYKKKNNVEAFCLGDLVELYMDGDGRGCDVGVAIHPRERETKC